MLVVIIKVTAKLVMVLKPNIVIDKISLKVKNQQAETVSRIFLSNRNKH
jgi:hypothetical protein